MHAAKSDNGFSILVNRRRLLGAAIIALLAVIQLFSPAHPDLWWQELFQALHAPVFGLIAVCVVALTPLRWHWSKRLLVTMASVFVLSLLSEAAQIPLPNRSASLGDLFRDWFGAGSFVAAAIAFSPNFHVPRGRGRYLILLALLLMIWPLKALVCVSSAYWDRFQQVPSIAPFKSPDARIFYELNNASSIQTVNASRQFRNEFRFGQTGSSSIKFHDPWSDWRPYSKLDIDVDNLSTEPLALTIRIHDEAHLRGDQPHNDRFNRRLEFAPGRHEIRVELQDVRTAPVGREMQMGRIDGLVLFGTGSVAGARFVIHDIRLE